MQMCSIQMWYTNVLYTNVLYTNVLYTNVVYTNVLFIYKAEIEYFGKLTGIFNNQSQSESESGNDNNNAHGPTQAHEVWRVYILPCSTHLLTTYTVIY